MFKALLRIGLVTLAVVLVITGLISMARVTGRQKGQTPPHPWFERPTWDIRAPVADDVCAHPLRASADLIYLLPVRKTPARWQVSCAAGPDLGDFLKSSTHADWLIEIEAGAGEDLDNLVDILNEGPTRRIAILAHSQRAARALRKKMPGWIFAADDAALLRLHMFSSLYLESVFDFWPDFVIADAGDGRDRRAPAPHDLSAREVTELKRRLKRVVWDAGPNHATAPFEADGTVHRGTSL